MNFQTSLVTLVPIVLFQSSEAPPWLPLQTQLDLESALDHLPDQCLRISIVVHGNVMPQTVLLIVLMH